MQINKNYFILGILSFSLIGCVANSLISPQIPFMQTQKTNQTQLIKMPFNIEFSFPSNNLHTQAIDKDKLDGLRFTINKADNALTVFDEIDLAYIDSYAANKAIPRTFMSLPNVIDVVGSDLFGGASGIYDKTTSYALIITKKSTTVDSTNISGTFDIMPGNNNVITADGLTFRRDSSGKILKKDGTAINGDGVLKRDALGYITEDRPAYEALQGIRVMGYFDAKAGENNSINVNWGRTPVAKIISMLKSSTTSSIRDMARDDIFTSTNRTALQTKFNTATVWGGDDKIQTFTKHPALIDIGTFFGDDTTGLVKNPKPASFGDLGTRITATAVSFHTIASFKGKVVLKDKNGAIMPNTEIKLWFGDASADSFAVNKTSGPLNGFPSGIIDFTGVDDSFKDKIMPSNATIYPSPGPVYKMQAEVIGFTGTPTITKGSKGINFINSLTIPPPSPPFDSSTTTIELTFFNLPLRSNYKENLRLTNKFNGTANTAVHTDLVWSTSTIDDIAKEFTLPNSGAFSLKGTSYTKVWVHSNGALEFTTSTPTATYPSTKAREADTAFTSRNMITPLWTDLEFKAAGDGVFYKEDAAAPNNKHITFLWKGTQKGTSNNVQFEATLTYDGFGTTVTNPDTNNADCKGYIEFSYNNLARTLISYANPVIIGVAGNYAPSLQPANWASMGIDIPIIPNPKESMFFYYN